MRAAVAAVLSLVFVSTVIRVSPTITKTAFQIATEQAYNGLFLLAHGITIKYLSLCEPAVTTAFRDDGSLMPTSEAVKRIRGFVVLLLHACMQV